MIKLAGNVGSYNAILAGMKYATGDCTTVIAADLQDPPELIAEMYAYWEKGIKLVIANRQDRDDPWLTKIFANTFQFLIKKFGLRNIPDGGFDFVLFDKALREEVVRIDEKNTNVLYLLVWLGYDYINIPYQANEERSRQIKVDFYQKAKALCRFLCIFFFFPYKAHFCNRIVSWHDWFHVCHFYPDSTP